MNFRGPRLWHGARNAHWYTEEETNPFFSLLYLWDASIPPKVIRHEIPYVSFAYTKPQYLPKVLISTNSRWIEISLNKALFFLLSLDLESQKEDIKDTLHWKFFKGTNGLKIQKERGVFQDPIWVSFGEKFLLEEIFVEIDRLLFEEKPLADLLVDLFTLDNLTELSNKTLQRFFEHPFSW